jgi:hypothetical protein
MPFAEKAHVSTNAASQFDRAIIKEPTYQSAPKYCLLALGNRSDVKVWMVEDGRRLFVDKNANGDLTDDGPPIEPGKVRDLGAAHWDFEYSFDAITPDNGSRHTNFVLRRWNYGETEDSYGLSLSVDGKMPMYAGLVCYILVHEPREGSGGSLRRTIHAEAASEKRFHHWRVWAAVEPMFPQSRVRPRR